VPGDTSLSGKSVLVAGAGLAGLVAARDLADMYFFETLVRLHRAGEGAPYTGLKPAGRDLGPAIPGADRALETGDVEPLVKLLVGAAEKGVRQHFAEARGLDVKSVAIFSIAPLFMGGIGNPVSVWIANRLAPHVGNMARTRRIMAYIGFAGASMFLLLSTRMNDPLMATLAIGLASFSNDLVMPGAWSACMNVGGKHAGSLSGMMNMTGNIAGAIAPQVIGFILYFTNRNWNLTFYLSAAIYLMGIVCWMFLDPITPLKDDTPPGLQHAR